VDGYDFLLREKLINQIFRIIHKALLTGIEFLILIKIIKNDKSEDNGL